MGRDAPSVDTIIYMSGQPSALIVDIVLLVKDEFWVARWSIMENAQSFQKY